MSLWKKLSTFGVAAALGVAGVMAMSGGAGADGVVAAARLKDAAGTTLGSVRMATIGNGKILVRVQVRGLTPGFHGFHIHTVGACTAPDFASAGGTGRGRFLTDRYALADLFDADGSALVVHAAADNYANIPTRYTATGAASPGPDATTLLTGDAGARTLCGEITRI